MPGSAAQATMHEHFVRRPLAETVSTTQAYGAGRTDPLSSLQPRAPRCDDSAELYVDGLRLRRDRVEHWVFPRSRDYPCVATGPVRKVRVPRAGSLDGVACLSAA